MRVPWIAPWLLLLPLALLACYDPPLIPRERPLTCASPEAGREAERCPDGFQCVGDRICAPDQCASDSDCPAGLVCTVRFECDLPGSPGAEAGAGDGSSSPADALEAPGADGGVLGSDVAAEAGFSALDTGGGQ